MLGLLLSAVRVNAGQCSPKIFGGKRTKGKVFLVVHAGGGSAWLERLETNIHKGGCTGFGLQVFGEHSA